MYTCLYICHRARLKRAAPSRLYGRRNGTGKHVSEAPLSLILLSVLIGSPLPEPAPGTGEDCWIVWSSAAVYRRPLSPLAPPLRLIRPLSRRKRRARPSLPRTRPGGQWSTVSQSSGETNSV